MEKQTIEGIYKHIIQDVLLPNKNIHLINLEDHDDIGAYAVNDKGYRLQVHIESTYDLVNFMKPVFTAIHLIGALNTDTKEYRQLNEDEQAFVTEMQSIEQALIDGEWLLKDSYSDEEGFLKEKSAGRNAGLQTKQSVTAAAMVNKSSFEKVLYVSSKNASSIILYDTYEGKKLPVGIGFVVTDDAGEEVFVIFSFHTFNGLFSYLSAILNFTPRFNLNTHHTEIAIAQELLRMNSFLKKAGVFIEK